MTELWAADPDMARRVAEHRRTGPAVSAETIRDLAARVGNPAPQETAPHPDAERDPPMPAGVLGVISC